MSAPVVDSPTPCGGLRVVLSHGGGVCGIAKVNEGTRGAGIVGAVGGEKAT